MSPAPDAAIAAFWKWWADAGPRLERVFDANEHVPEALTNEITRHVHAIDPGLAWEVGKSNTGKSYAFSLSSQGDFLLRKLAGKWVRSAPASPDWTFLPAREANLRGAHVVLSLRGLKLDFERIRFATERDEARLRLGVAVYHPLFESADEQLALQASFIVLDSILGEDDVERWLGEVEVLKEPRGELVDAAELVARARSLAAAVKPDAACLVETGTPEAPVLGVFNLQLKRLDYLEHDWHLAVDLPFTGENHDSIARAHALEEELVEKLKPAGAVWYGHVTEPAEKTMSMLFYVKDRETTGTLVNAWIAQHAGASAEWTSDPTWEEYGF